ncbi:MAG: branched-chain amino acid ABC transporter permease [Thermostichales cyanobacterium DRC_bins_46]
MTAPVKMGVSLGWFVILTTLLFGRWSGAVMGAMMAAAATYLVAHGSHPVLTRRQGSILGSQVGLVVGAMGLLGSLVQAWGILPLSGFAPLPVLEALSYGAGSLIFSLLGGMGMGVFQVVSPRWRQVNLMILAGFLVLFPVLDRLVGLNWIATVIYILIFALLALGLNITVGYAGLLDLGYAAFFAIGAYATGILTSPQMGLEWSFWLVLWIAAAIAAVAGIILGTPTLPLVGDYLAIVTLGFGQIVPILFRNLTRVTLYEPISKLIADATNQPELAICLLGCERPINLTNGEAGINPIGRPWLTGVGFFASDNYFAWCYLILVLVTLAVIAISRLRDSRLGRAWNAMREDELAASTMGINLVQTKLLAFSMGATFSGFAGAFYAAFINAIFPSVFDFSISVIILCMVILGGLGNLAGVILGCVIIMGSDRLFLEQMAQVLKDILNTSILPNIPDAGVRELISVTIDPTQMRLLLFGITLVIVMIVRPEGLIPRSQGVQAVPPPAAPIPSQEPAAVSSQS